MSGPDISTEVPILQARQVGKLYSRGLKSTRKRLGRAAFRAFFNLKAKSDTTKGSKAFWAVNNVSFDLNRGRAIGIIGLNGSGKTTLLRMLAGQLMPDAGEIVINGTSAAMIDLQAGFQPSASGRENIFLRAAALGFRREQTLAHMDEIIAFSELGDAIEAPINTYSSGMAMRLAFSVMIIVSPDVLFIDEVLAVGDFRFRQKCLAKVREMRDRSAFVFVSHSMPDIESFCDHVIVLNKGNVHFEGPPEEAIKVYEALEDTSVPVSIHENVTRIMGPTIQNSDALERVEHVWCDMDGNPIEETPFGDSFQLKVTFQSKIDIRKLAVGVPVWSLNGHYTTGLSTQISSDPINVKANENVKLRLTVSGGHINPGVLKSMLAISDGPEHLYREPNKDLGITSAPHPTWGAVTVPHHWARVDKGAPSNPLKRFT